MITKPNGDVETVVRLKRTFAGPREKVFQAWTEPDQLKKWWGPKGATTPVVEIDLRVGGKYRFGMQFPEEDIFYVSGIYQEVQPPEKLVFSWRWEKPDMDFGETQVTIVFHEAGNSTEVTLIHKNFPTKESCESHRQGWSDFYDKFVEFIDRKGG
jgi:uncharacterized protein YndB with AHSA1/START domain